MSHPRRQRHLWATGREAGSAVIEATIGVPAFMLFVGLIVFAGRVAVANQAVGSAATEAARSASISRTQAQAADTAKAAATQALSNQKLNCLQMTISVDTSGFASPVGTPASVRATVTCVVNLSDLAVPGVPGTRTVSASMSSPLDTYRER
ncbi:TadE/TadG family type IV pilus assembly protein [Pedococcus sp. P5_B7]